MATLVLTEDIVLTYRSNMYYHNDTGYLYPLYIINSSDTSYTVSIEYQDDITDNENFIIIGSNYVQIYGLNICTIKDVTSYPGLIQNTAYTTVIENIKINSDGSTLVSNGGWICQSSTINTTILNCSSNGAISVNCGGIIGFGNNNCTIRNCHTSGLIEYGGGGIAANNSQNVLIVDCYSNGVISDHSGGIVGGLLTENVTVSGCYSTGLIGSHSGGIIGDDPNNVTISNCYTTGTISVTGGGILCRYATNYNVTNCYTCGFSSTNTGGIISDNSSDLLSCYSETNNYLSATWKDSHAHNTLSSGWISTQVNTPYKIRSYTKNMYSNNRAIVIKHEGIIDTSIEASGTYSIVEVNNTLPISNITINSDNGYISYNNLEKMTYYTNVMLTSNDDYYFCLITIISLYENTDDPNVKIKLSLDQNVNIGKMIYYLSSSPRIKGITYKKNTLDYASLQCVSFIINKNVYICKFYKTILG